MSNLHISSVAVQRTLTLHCLTSLVLPGNITWSYTVTLAVNRIVYLSRWLGQFVKSLKLIINFFIIISQLVSITNNTETLFYHSRVLFNPPVLFPV